MSSEHPTPKPTLGADDPIGWYECRHRLNSGTYRQMRYWDGRDLWHMKPNSSIGSRLSDYTDFIGPLTTQPGVAELVEAAKDMVEVLDAYYVDGVLEYQIRLRKALAALAATEPGTREGEGSECG